MTATFSFHHQSSSSRKVQRQKSEDKRTALVSFNVIRLTLTCGNISVHINLHQIEITN